MIAGHPWWFWLLLAAGSYGLGVVGTLISNRITR